MVVDVYVVVAAAYVVVVVVYVVVVVVYVVLVVYMALVDNGPRPAPNATQAMRPASRAGNAAITPATTSGSRSSILLPSCAQVSASALPAATS